MASENNNPSFFQTPWFRNASQILAVGTLCVFIINLVLNSYFSKLETKIEVMNVKLQVADERIMVLIQEKNKGSRYTREMADDHEKENKHEHREIWKELRK